jgi:hypothetical protein
MAHAEADDDHQKVTWLQESRALVIRCLTTLNSKIQTGAPECVSFHLNKPMLYKSHDVANLKFNGILWQVDKAFPEEVSSIAEEHKESKAGNAKSPVLMPSSMRHEGDEPQEPRRNLWIDDAGSIMPLNPLHDYIYRPQEINLPLYLFYEQYTKKAAAFKGGKAKGKRQFPKDCIRFTDGHPQQKTHYLRPNKHAQVPWIQGPSLARDGADNPERFGKLASCLFKTWWSWEQLRNPDNSWAETWEAHRQHLEKFDPLTASAAETYNHRVVLRVLRNATAIHMGVETVSEERRARDIHRKTFKSERLKGFAPDDNPLQEAFRHYLDEEPLALPTLGGSDVRSHKFAREALDIIARHCPQQKMTSAPVSNELDPIRNWTSPEWEPHQHRSTTSKVNKMNAMSFQTMLDGKPSPSSAKPTTAHTESGHAPAQSPVLVPEAQDLPTLSEVADKFTLNEKQRYAFLVVGDTFLQEYRGLTVPAERRAQVAQVLMYIGGSGGVGKSRVIASIVHLFESYGKRHWLRICAYTAFAAGQVGGTTTHALMAEQKATGRKKDVTYNPSVSKLQKLQRMWADARFCIIDECSMLSCQWNGMLAARMEAGRPEISAPFAKIHMIYCGDFSQLPPISTTGRPMYTRVEWLDEKMKRSKYGREMWGRLTHAIVLNQGMRAAGDPDFQQFLERLRHGKSRLNPSRGGTYKGEVDDYDYIHTRLIDRVDMTPALCDQLQHNGGIVTRNVVRMLTNNDSAIKEARHGRIRPLVAVAEDKTGEPHDRLSFQVRRRLLRQHESAANGYYAGMLVLVPGMKYALKSHMARDLPGLSRNSVGTLLKVVLDPREPPLKDSNSTKPHFLKYLPQQVLMHFEDAPDVYFHPNLPRKTLSIRPRSASMDEKTPKKSTIKRRQLPFVLASFGTDYNNQGRTFLGAGFVDLARPTDPRGYDAATPYVCLSRFTKVSDIILLRPIPLAQFKRVISHDQLRDAARLQTLSNNTIVDNKHLFKENFPDFDPLAPIARSALRQAPNAKPSLKDLFAQFRSGSMYAPPIDEDSADEESQDDERGDAAMHDFTDDECTDNAPEASIAKALFVVKDDSDRDDTGHHTQRRQSKRKRVSTLPASARKKRLSMKAKQRQSSALENENCWKHISPPPQSWTHNNCGPYSVMEVCNVLLRCVPDLSGLLAPDTLHLLETLTSDKMRSAAITRTSPWKINDVCPCAYCRQHGRTAQDSNIERRLYQHMNTQRTRNDKDMEQLGDYVVGDSCDIRRMFEAVLGLRTADGQPRPGCGLAVINRCCLCATESVVPLPTLEVDDALGRPIPGAPHGSTQEILDQQTGVVGMLHHLPNNPYEHLGAVKKFGGQCPRCLVDGKRVDTMLPWGLDDTQPLPPILRFNKALGSRMITSIPDTVTIQPPHKPNAVIYELLAVVYGSGRTRSTKPCDHRYNPTCTGPWSKARTPPNLPTCNQYTIRASMHCTHQCTRHCAQHFARQFCTHQCCRHCAQHFARQLPCPCTHQCAHSYTSHFIGTHFTCDARYDIDKESRAFTHYDPFHFAHERVLSLSNNLPACNGGRPHFLPRHTAEMRATFDEFTQIKSVAAVVYGQITSSLAQSTYPLHQTEPQQNPTQSDDVASRHQCTSATTTSIKHKKRKIPSTSAALVSSCSELECCCNQDLSDSLDTNLISCDLCDVWLHMSCVNIHPQHIPDEYVCFHCDPPSIQ